MEKYGNIRRNALRAVAAVLALVAIAALCVFTACSCSRIYRKSTFNYNHIAFKAADAPLEAFNAAAENAQSAISRGSDLEAVRYINKMVTELTKIMGDYVYINVEYSKNTEGEYKQLYVDYSGYYSEAQKAYIDVLYAALNSSIGDTLFSGWSESEKQTIRDRHDMMSGNYLTIQEEITRLETEYNSLTAGMNETYAYAVEDILLALVGQYNLLIEGTEYGSYMEYAYESYGRTYDPSEAAAMCENVKTYIAPIVTSLYSSISDPEWGLIAQASSSYYTDEITRNDTYIRSYTREIGGYMSEAYAYMKECNLHYMATPGKNPNGLQGAFTTYLYNQDAPYIYQYCTGGYSDLTTFIHEFGHFTSYYINDESGGYDLDTAEIQSQANEMLFLPYLSEIYGDAAGVALEKYELFNSLYWSVIMGCLFDELQRDVYADPAAYEEDGAITALFGTLLEEYGIAEYSYDRFGDSFVYWWAQVSHTVASPFYYVSYAVSALPSLVILEDSRTKGRQTAIDEYNYIQTYGNGDLEFSELLSRAGVGSPFYKTTISGLANFIQREYIAV